MSRYYSSQQYARLDDPDWNPDASHSEENLHAPHPYEPAHSQENLHAPRAYEPYQSYTNLADKAPLNESLPSAYFDTKYPQGGFRGGLKNLKSKQGLKWSEWTRKKKILVVGAIVALLVIIAIAVGVAVAETDQPSFSYTQSFVNVHNAQAFREGGASTRVTNHDGIGEGVDKYVYYQGDASQFPPSTEWVSFQNMWTSNRPLIEGGCATLGDGSNDTPEQIEYIFQAIKNRSTVSYVDHRFILAVILQESLGCVHVGQTTSDSGVTNPGLMQSHNGHSYSSANPSLSILAMVQDGTQGTEDGAGLVQGLNKYGNVYDAARYYNSGEVGSDLSKVSLGTACYVSDVANRLTGWTTAKNECPDSGE